jgi:hypothetical protein
MSWLSTRKCIFFYLFSHELTQTEQGVSVKLEYSRVHQLLVITSSKLFLYKLFQSLSLLSYINGIISSLNAGSVVAPLNIQQGITLPS